MIGPGAAQLLSARYRDRAAQLFGQGDPEGAGLAARRALALAPDSLMPLVLWGAAQRAAGRSIPALEAARRAVRRAPDRAALWINRGNAAGDSGATEEMVDSFRRATHLSPADPETWHRLGAARASLDALDDGIVALRRAVALRPDRPALMTELGMALAKAGRAGCAVAMIDRATCLDPSGPNPYLALGNAQLAMGQGPAARGALLRGASLAPESPALRQGLALACLASGDPATGFSLEASLVGPPPSCVGSLPRWTRQRVGRDRPGDLVVWPSGGVGDEIRLISMIPQLRSRVERVRLLCDRRLVSIVRRSMPAIDCVPSDDPGPIPAGSMQVGLAALQPLLRKRLSDFPISGGFLHARPDLIERWRSRVDALGPGVKVGIAWRSGRVSAVRGRHHGALADYAAILRLVGVVPVLLQYDDCLDEVAQIEQASGVTVHRWGDLDRRDDFESLAALCSGLDLVVTTGSAVMTVAGAVGAETWCILRAGHHDQLGTGRLPWFPSVRVFPWSWNEGLEMPAGRISAALSARLPDIGAPRHVD